MTSPFPARRAAEEFDQALSGSASPAVADRYADLLATVEALRAQPEVLPRAEFAGDLRARLVEAARTELAGAPGVVRRLPDRPEPRTSRHRRLGTVAATLVIVGGGAGMAAAASGALPGDALYPVKRGLEAVGTIVHTSDAGRGEALLDQAATRLAEARDLQALDADRPALTTATLGSFRETATEGSDLLLAAYTAGGDRSHVATVREFTAEQMAVLAALAAVTEDPAVAAALRHAADTVATIDQQARVLCASCGPERTLDLPDALVAAATDGSLARLLARPVVQVRADLAALERARDERLRAAAGAAEETARDLPDPSVPTTGAGPVPVDGDTVTGLVTPDGRSVPLPAPGGGPAVDHLVEGVTGDLGAVTDPVDKVTGGVTGKAGKDPVDELVDDLTHPLEDTTGGLLP